MISMREAELESRLDLLNQEMASLAGEVVRLRRDHRAELDALRLEIETLKRFLADAHTAFPERYRSLEEQVRLEVSPE